MIRFLCRKSMSRKEDHQWCHWCETIELLSGLRFDHPGSHLTRDFSPLIFVICLITRHVYHCWVLPSLWNRRLNIGKSELIRPWAITIFTISQVALKKRDRIWYRSDRERRCSSIARKAKLHIKICIFPSINHTLIWLPYRPCERQNSFVSIRTFCHQTSLFIISFALDRSREKRRYIFSK